MKTSSRVVEQMFAALAAVAALTAGAAGCGGWTQQPRPTAPLSDSTPEPAAPPADAGTSAPAEVEQKVVEDQGPADVSPARAALAWVLEVLNGDGTINEADASERFAPSFLSKVPPDQVVKVFAAMSQQLSPAAVESVADGESDTRLVATLTTKAGPIETIIGLEAAEPHRFETLLLRPGKVAARHASFEEAAKALAAVGARTALYAARVNEDGACEQVFSDGGAQPLAIGSAFKLYVLAALVDEIEAGRVTWDQEIEVTDRLKSLPSGELQNAPAGTAVTVSKAAEAMIAISDNTATDMLINLLGRRRIEKTARKLGNKRNEPFLTTRELFLLKLVASDADRSRYAGKRKVAKRAYLKGPLARKKLPDLDQVDIGAWDKPRAIDTLEWFASAEQMCGVMSYLMKTGARTKDEVLRGILSRNPGMAVDRERWAYVAFKGGSEPGVFNLTFLLIGRDGQTFSLVVGVNDATSAFDQGPILEVAGSAVDLLGKR